MTASRGLRAYIARAKHRQPSVDPELVARCVPVYRECAKRADSRNGGEKPGNDTGRNHPTYSPDQLLAEHGVRFGDDRRRWAAYEKAIRAAAQSA